MPNIFYMFIGAAIALNTISIINITWNGSSRNIIKSAIETCEKDLPRNKHCKIIGVVDET